MLFAGTVKLLTVPGLTSLMNVQFSVVEFVLYILNVAGKPSPLRETALSAVPALIITMVIVPFTRFSQAVEKKSGSPDML